MLNNYLILAVRHLLKHKTHSGLMIFGLAVGFAASAVILILNYSELSYDRHWPDADRIYQLESIVDLQHGSAKTNDSGASDKIYTAMKGRIAEIGYISRKQDRETRISSQNSNNPEAFSERASLIDNDFFDIFPPTLLQGSLADFYKDESAVIISDDLAKKLFSYQPIIGKVISLDTTGFKSLYVAPGDNTRTAQFKDFKVVAVIAFPEKNRSNGYLQLFTHTIEEESEKGIFTYAAVPTYLKLRSGANPKMVESQLPVILDKHVPLPSFFDRKPSEVFSVSLVNIRDAHKRFLQHQGYKDNSGILYGLAAIIMAIASINYINLALAAHTGRQREVALRKTLGAEQKHIAQQFFFESLLISTLAFALALVLIELSIPWLKNIFALTIDGKDLYDPKLLAYLATAALVSGTISGIYPSVYLARLNPAVTLKSNKSRETQRSIHFRQLLVTIQFVISGILLSCTLINFAQTHHLQSYLPGFQTHHIFYATHEQFSANKLDNIYNLKDRIARLPNVEAVSFAMPGLMLPQGQEGFVRAGAKPDTAVYMARINLAAADELQTLNIKLLAGSYFSPSRLPQTPSKANQLQPKVYISAQALKALGFNSADEAINQQIEILPTSSEGLKQVFTIVAVTDSVHPGKLNAPAKPVVFWPISDQVTPVALMIRYRQNPQAVEAEVKKIWQNILGYSPYTWRIEDAIADEYKNENLIAKFIYLFTGIAIFISSLGFYGLAAHATTKRTKEIGLRKIHGARNFTIVKLLLWQFSRPVLLANLLVWPIGFYTMNGWLEKFVDRIDINWWGPSALIASSLLALLIAWLTVGGHAYLVARARPVDALREE